MTDKIDLDIYKMLTRTVLHVANLQEMGTNLSQLFVGALGIKGAAVFVLNPEKEEFEILASFGLSVDYMNKGPLFVNKSLAWEDNREPVVVRDVNNTDRLQYPEHAKGEGIGSIVSLPVKVYGRIIGAMRLYHSEPWDVTDNDLDSLSELAETIGLSMLYSRLLTALVSVKESVNEVHDVWLRPRKM